MRFIFRFLQLAFQMYLRLLFRIQVQGREHIPRRGKLLLAANHVSGYDPFVIGSLVPRAMYFLAKKELFQNPLLGAVLRILLHAIPVDRRDLGHATMRRINQLLAAGEAILLFPEGTRSRSGQIGEAKAGVGMLAAMNAAAIVPVRVEGLCGTAGSLLRRPRIKVIFGPLLAVAPYLQNGMATKEVYREIAAAVIDGIRTLGATAALDIGDNPAKAGIRVLP